MDILHLVDRLEEIFNAGTAIPLSHKLMVDEDRVLEIIDQMRVSIPEEVKKSQQVLAQRDRILAQAQEEATRTVQLAKALGAKVIVTSVAPILLTKGQGPWDPADPPSRHREEVDHAAARLAELGVQGVETVVTGGDPAHAIVELADERKADLIVLGAHDGGLVSRLLEGSVGDAVAHRAHTDVLIVH